jgi:acetyl-CoA carboxylase biotin carboxylase subunit
MKVLIANRGEIAVRVIRACRELGLGAVAVYSDCDRASLHVRMADEAHHLGPSPPAESYLRIDRILDVARRAGARLVHPGYGFLAENDAFAQACVDAGLTFVGPRPSAMRLMGSKTAARRTALAAGVPVVPGADSAFAAEAPVGAIADEARRIGYPLIVKAVAGGGGKGMRTILAPADLASAVELARSEAQSAFGDSAIYLERRLEAPRHIEVQLMGDEHGTVVPFVERECSIQRRHQKVVEESPAAAPSVETRRDLADAAARVARSAGYTNAGTIEFLVDSTGRFYFLEMNARLQVEHPVTEMVAGVDLVRWQLRVALGEPLTISPERALVPRGHAIECRIYAEDPDAGFVPSPGLVRALATPSGPGVRDDRGVATGSEVPVFYDSLISKLVVWDESRALAIARLSRALDEYRVIGLKTTVPFFQWLVRQPAFVEGRFDTTYLDRVLAERGGGRPFVVARADEVRDAAVAVAVTAWWERTARARARPAVAAPRPAAADGWRRAARREALRVSDFRLRTSGLERRRPKGENDDADG